MGNTINIESELFTNVKRQKFALDTNVLYWMFYDKCSYSNEVRQKKYQNTVTKLKMHNEMFVSPLCLYELFVIIEKNEFKIYSAKHHKDETFKLKDYREIISERNSVKDILNITYKNINQFAKIVSQTIDKNTVENLATTFAAHKLDIFDKSLVEFCALNGIENIVTDDKDYRTVGNELNIYTANQHYFDKSPGI